MLVEREAFPAEVAADVRRMHDDRLRRQVERLRHLLAQRERRLVRAYDVRDVALDPHQGRTRLDVRLMDWRHAESVFEDPRSLRESAGNIAVFVDLVALQVRMRHRRSLHLLPATCDDRVVGGIGMQHRRAVGERRLGVEDRRLLFVLDVDERGRGLSVLERVGRDRSDAVADESHAIPGEHRPVLKTPAEPRGPHVRAGEHRADARRGARPGHVDTAHERVRIRASNEGDVQHPVALDIRREVRGTGDLAVPLDAPLRRREDVGRGTHARRRARRGVALGHAAAVRPRHCANCASS